MLGYVIEVKQFEEKKKNFIGKIWLLLFTQTTEYTEKDYTNEKTSNEQQIKLNSERILCTYTPNTAHSINMK